MTVDQLINHLQMLVDDETVSPNAKVFVTDRGEERLLGDNDFNIQDQVMNSDEGEVIEDEKNKFLVITTWS